MKALLILTLLSGVARGDALHEPLQLAGDNATEIRGFVEAATEQHGDFGERAATFLVEGMPPQDLKMLKRDWLLKNLALAIKARETFPWGKAVPEEIFFNDVLPYASLDETRESWRDSMFAETKKIVADCQTTTEAAQTLNQQYFDVIKVHYNIGRKRPNQSPSESQELGMATCTGLSIILVDACRSVGVPARVAGTPLWTNKRGNHTWVEIWDAGEWYFTGADEYNAKGLNHGWFVADAAKALADDWKHSIWATSWRKTGSHFPMVWNRWSKDVAGVNVTSRYANQQLTDSNEVTAYCRICDTRGGDRLIADVEVIDLSGKLFGTVTTKAGRTDLNDMPLLKLARNQEYQARVKLGDEVRTTTIKTSSAPEMTLEWNWEELGEASTEAGATGAAKPQAIRQWLELPANEREGSLPEADISRDEAAQAIDMIWEKLRAEQELQRQAELDQLVVKAAGKEMKYLKKEFGDAPAGERSLWISMHGGGGAPARVNDQQWKNQIRLYEPEEGFVVAPRAPTDNWNLWHEAHIDELFDRLIENFVLLRGVNPERVYLMGYSAGGDGVYQLAPRMADRFAAASMMAGHPNDASPLGLRNLPFMIFMGGEDAAYQRNKVAAAWGAQLGELRKSDEQGYEHKVTIYDGLGHWMQGKDAEALPWMLAHTRVTWPKKVVWRQSGRTHERFYWLAVPEDSAEGGQLVRADVRQQHIDIQAPDELKQLELRLSDTLVDLDQPIEVTVNGKLAYSGQVQRSVAAIWKSLNQRLDRSSVATSTLSLTW